MKIQCKACEYKNTKNCEVEQFLADFIKTQYQIDIYSVNFTCPDKIKSNMAYKSRIPDLEFKIGTKEYVIEAKGLDNTYLCRMQHASRCIGNSMIDVLQDIDNMNNVFGEDTEEFIKLFNKYGLKIEFYEDILFATNLLGKDDCRNREFIQVILQCSLDALRYASNRTFDKIIPMKQVYSIDKKKFHKKKNKAVEIAQLSLIYKENMIKKVDMPNFVYPPYNVLRKPTDKSILWYTLNSVRDSVYDNICNLEERITFSIEVTGNASDFATDVGYNRLLIESDEILNEYWVDKLSSTDKKMASYNTSRKRILFINNEGYRINYNSDMYKNIITIIRKNARNYNHIDEIWLEYYITECCNDDLDFIMILGHGEKKYEKIWCKELSKK